MYKSDLRNAFSSIDLVSGGGVEQLLSELEKSAVKAYAALGAFSRNSNSATKEGAAQLTEALSGVQSMLSRISPSSLVVELNKLGSGFDEVMRTYPGLEAALRPGRQALAALSGAYDVFLQKNKSYPTTVGLFGPGLELATCYKHYRALETLFEESKSDYLEGDGTATLEISGAERLSRFTMFSGMLFHLVVASEALAQENLSPVESGLESPLRITSIESGSPIQISISGGAKALQMLLTMIRDVIRVPYLHLTSPGKAIHSMEIFARARELGIDSPDVLHNLEKAMETATRIYSESIKDGGGYVAIDGVAINRETPMALPYFEAMDAIDEASPTMLEGPEE